MQTKTFIEMDFCPQNRAILKQKLEIVTFLIENGVDINEKDGKNWTLIDKASLLMLEILKYLKCL